MKIPMRFGDLDLFCCVFDGYQFNGNDLIVHVSEGLSVPTEYESAFNYIYLHDQVKDIKFDKWLHIDGVLHLRVLKKHDHDNGEQWVLINKPYEINELLKYKFFGDCNLVFESVGEYRMNVSLYQPNEKAFNGKEFSESKIVLCQEKNTSVFTCQLEGILKKHDLYGWAFFEIFYRNFYIQVN